RPQPGAQHPADARPGDPGAAQGAGPLRRAGAAAQALRPGQSASTWSGAAAGAGAPGPRPRVIREIKGSSSSPSRMPPTMPARTASHGLSENSTPAPPPRSTEYTDQVTAAIPANTLNRVRG